MKKEPERNPSFLYECKKCHRKRARDRINLSRNQCIDEEGCRARIRWLKWRDSKPRHLCTGCLRFRSSSQFNYGHRCRSCDVLKAQKWYEKNLARRKKWKRGYERKKTVEDPLFRQRKRYHNEKFPKRRKARTKLSNSLRDGKIVRRPCQECGSKNSHAHHYDYSRPLDVVWLCTEHHWKAHGRTAKLRAKS